MPQQTTKIGELELNKIYCMDCLEGMKMLPDESVDLIITSPLDIKQIKKTYYL